MVLPRSKIAKRVRCNDDLGCRRRLLLPERFMTRGAICRGCRVSHRADFWTERAVKDSRKAVHSSRAQPFECFRGASAPMMSLPSCSCQAPQQIGGVIKRLKLANHLLRFFDLGD